MLQKSNISKEKFLSFLDFLHSESFSLKDVKPLTNLKVIKLTKEEFSLKIVQRKDSFYFCSKSFRLLKSFNLS